LGPGPCHLRKKIELNKSSAHSFGPITIPFKAFAKGFKKYTRKEYLSLNLNLKIEKRLK
jgi:hypothetical protein